jgi:hypothetical protein
MSSDPYLHENGQTCGVFCRFQNIGVSSQSHLVV